jgi:hypothetical protein
MEHLSTKQVADLATLGTEIHAIEAPRAGWPAFSAAREKFDSSFLARVQEQLRQFSNPDPLLCVRGQSYDPLDLAGMCHHVFRENEKSPPNTVFMGDAGQQTYFAVFKRALSTSDFAALRSVGERQ